MRSIITGSRHWDDWELLVDMLECVWSEPSRILVVGDCPTGVDLIVRQWCLFNRVPHEVFRADWDLYGRAAGPRRNQSMIDSGAQECIAFPLGSSRGTWDCVERAMSRGIPTAALVDTNWVVLCAP
jgi:hypothetical protein